MKICAPVKDANGVYASVQFVNGVGETDDPHLIDWFTKHGYTIEISQNSVEKGVEMSQDSLEKCDEVVVEENEEIEMMGYADKSPSLDDMNPNELRDWAKANGKGHLIKNIRNKEKLLEIIRG